MQSLSFSHRGGQESFITLNLPGHILILLKSSFEDCLEKNDIKNNQPAINKTGIMIKYFLDIQLICLDYFIKESILDNVRIMRSLRNVVEQI